MKSKKLLVVLGMCMGMALVGCGTADSFSNLEKPITSEKVQDDEERDDEEQQSSGYFSAKDAIKIEEIDWSVAPGILDGESFISFNYTNNSKYTIMDVEMEFRQKEGTTTEQLSVFDSIKERFEWTDEKVAETYILGYNRKMAEPGESVEDSPCVINGTYTLVENMEQYEIMQPDMVSIAFIGDDGKGYAIYYDFNTQTYGEASTGPRELQNWSDSEISALIPKVEAPAINVSTDEEERFFFYAYGVTRAEFETYVEAVKARGFTNVGYEGDNSYRASNADGIEANITYNAVEETMTGEVEPE